MKDSNDIKILFRPKDRKTFKQIDIQEVNIWHYIAKGFLFLLIPFIIFWVNRVFF